MYIDNVKNIQAVQVTAPGANSVVKQVLVGPAQGWEGWVMRLFTLAGNGNTPRHSHPWPHINYVVKGSGTLLLDGKEYDLEPGSVAFVPGGKEHQFINRGEQDLALICIVPEEGEM